MKTVSVSQLKAHLSRYLREVKRGGEIQVLDRGVPVARLTQPGGGGANDNDSNEDRRRRLARAGVLRMGSGQVGRLLRVRALEVGVSLTDALQSERDDRA